MGQGLEESLVVRDDCLCRVVEGEEGSEEARVVCLCVSCVDDDDVEAGSVVIAMGGLFLFLFLIVNRRSLDAVEAVEAVEVEDREELEEEEEEEDVAQEEEKEEEDEDEEEEEEEVKKRDCPDDILFTQLTVSFLKSIHQILRYRIRLEQWLSDSCVPIIFKTAIDGSRSLI
jgi:hypothetical protein